jgi:ATP-dependent DNA helicase RecQ
LKQQFPEIDRIRIIYQSLCNFLKIAIGSGLSESYPLHISSWCSAFQLDANEAYYALKLLEMNGNISFSEGFFQPTKIRFAIGSTSLYNFQLNHPNLLPLTTLIVRSYPGIFDEFKSIHEDEIMKRLNVSKTVIKEMLKQLEQYGVIDISWSTDAPTVTFMTERLPLDRLVISPVVYAERKKAAQDKLAAVHDFVTSKTCRSAQLIRYFGQESDPCGKCDSCLKNALIKGESLEWRIIIEEQLALPKSLDELVIATGIPAELVKEFLKEMLAEKLLIYENGKYVRAN